MEDDLAAISRVVQDPDLREWLNAGGGDPQELIVELNLPPRKSAVVQGTRGRWTPRLEGPDHAAERDRALAELSAFAAQLLKQSPITLRAAQALAVSATPEQARQLAAHPLVKAIRPNRRLKLQR
jgi:hypothetical protein